MTANELYAFLDARWPTSLRCEWDNDGRMCLPDPEKPVRKVLLTLDVTAGAVEAAIAQGCDGIVAHHPLLFHPLKELYPGDIRAKKLLRMLENRLFCFCFHTRLDAAPGGVNDCLAEALGLLDVTPFEVEAIPMGRVGRLPSPMSERELALFCKERLGAPEVTYCSSGKKKIETVALLGGAGSDAIPAALALGADAFVTGDLHYNYLIDPAEEGVTVYRCGHFETENPVLREMKAALALFDPSVETVAYRSLPTETV